MKLYLLVLLLTLLSQSLAFQSHNHLTEPTPQSQVKQNKEEIQKLYDQQCKNFQPGPASTNPLPIKSLQSQSSFSIFNEDEIIQNAKNLREQNYEALYDQNTGTLWWAMGWWIALLITTIILFCVCVYGILIVKKQKKEMNNAVKYAIFTIILVLTIGLIWSAIALHSDNSMYRLQHSVQNTNCILYYNNLVYLNNKDTQLTPEWSGIETYSSNLDSVKAFYNSKLSESPYKDLQNTREISTISTTFKKAITAAQTLKQSKTSIANPDPNGRGDAASAYLTGVNNSEKKLEEQLNASLQTIEKNLKSYQKIQTDFGKISNQKTTLLKKIEQIQTQINKYGASFTNFSKEYIDFVSKWQAKIKDYYDDIRDLILWHHIAVTLLGLFGFALLGFASQIKQKKIGELCLHITWCYGTCFFIVYIIICMNFFLFGVAVQGGACEPLAYIQKDNKFISKVWPEANQQAELKSLLNDCLYNQNASLDSKLGFGALALLQDSKTVENEAKQYKPAVVKNPANFGDLTTLDTEATKIKSNYALALDKQGTTATNVAKTLSQLADNAKGKQSQEGGAHCKISKDQFVFDKNTCYAGYTKWTHGASEATHNQPTCFVIDSTFPSDLDTKRYTTAAFNKCTKINGKAYNVQLGAYTKSLSAYEKAVQQTVIPVQAKLESAKKGINDNVSSTATSVKKTGTTAASFSTALPKDFDAHVKKTEKSLQCSFIRDQFLARIQKEVCGYTESEIYNDYLWFSINCLIFGFFILVIAVVSFLYARNVGVTTKFIKSDVKYYDQSPQKSMQRSAYDNSYQQQSPYRDQQQQQQYEQQQYQDQELQQHQLQQQQQQVEVPQNFEIENQN